MFKSSLKSFLNTYYHFFTFMGVTALFAIIVVSFAIPQGIGILNNSGNELKTVLNSVSIPGDKIVSAFSEKIASLNWGNPIEALNTVLNKDWITAALKEILEPYGQQAAVVADQIKAIIDNCVAGLTNVVVISIVLILLSNIISYIFVKIVITKRSVNIKSFWRLFLSFVIDTLLFFAFIFSVFYAMKNNFTYFYVALGLAFVLYSAICLVNSWLAFGTGTVNFKDVFNLKNVFYSIIINAIIIGVSTGIVALFYFYVNSISALLISLPLYSVSFLIISNACNTYTATLAGDIKEKNNKQETKTA